LLDPGCDADDATVGIPSSERLAWGRGGRCPWGFSDCSRWTNPCALGARGGNLEALRWRGSTNARGIIGQVLLGRWGRHRAVLVWARQHDCP
jgi:hypothetical protein